MKKLIVIMLSVLLCFGITACGTGGGNDKDGIYFESESMSILVGRTEYVKVKLEDNYSGDTDKMDWSSSDESVLTVKDATRANLISGEIKAKKAGTVVVTASSSNGKTASITVSVLARLKASQTTVTIMEGDTAAFPLADKTNVTFTSADTSIATVQADGTITGVAPGETTVTATNGESDCFVAVKVNKVTLPVSTYAMTVLVNEPTDFPISEIANVTFASADPETVSVAADGKMTGLKKGETTVTATKNGVSATVNVGVVETKEQTVTLGELADERFNLYGRTKYQSETVGQAFYYTASGFDVSFYGTSLKAALYDGSATNGFVSLSVFVDDETMISASTTGDRLINLSGSKEYPLVSGLESGWHTVRVRKRTPYQGGGTVFGYFGLKSVTTDGFIGYTPNKSDFRIDFYGDSIASGYGNLTDGKSETAASTDGNMTYATILANKLGCDYNVVSVSGWGIAWRGNGDTSFSIPDQYDKLYVNSAENYDASGASVIVINLGTNDASALSGNNSLSVDYFKEKYTTFLTNLRAKNPNAYIVCAYGMMGTDSRISEAIDNVVAGKADGKISVLKFSNTGSGAHPLVSGHKTSAAELEAHLRSKNII